MPVYTEEEYDDKRKLVSNNKVEETIPEPEVEKEAPPLITYVLLYPDVDANCNNTNFSQSLDINGQVHNLVCKNGVVRTTEKSLADHLLKTGYLLLETINKEESK